MPRLDKNNSNLSLSDAISIACAEDPNMSYPFSSNDCDKLIAVCPPNWTTTAGQTSPFHSFSRISITDSSSNGSKYNLELESKSVETVSGLEFTIILAIPASVRDLDA